MSEVAKPFALPCITFKNFCPSLHFKRVVKRDNIPMRDQNPILCDKKFIHSHEQDCIEAKSNNNVVIGVKPTFSTIQ